MKAFVLAVAALLTVAGCGSRDGATPGSPGPSGTNLFGRTYLSTSVTENGQPRKLAEKTQVRLQFFDDGRLMASVGCNSMGGPVNLDGGKISVSEMPMTGMGCDQERHEQDTWLAKFLGSKPSWRTDGDKLTVSSDSIVISLIDREVAEPDLALEGTKWILNGMIDGQTASSMPDAANAILELRDGKVQVQTGCNSGMGSYELAGNTIRFNQVGTTKMACEGDRMRIENAVLEILNGEATYEIDAASLTLKNAAGKGLQFVGQR
jgi:heat shock protein HslJ